MHRQNNKTSPVDISESFFKLRKRLWTQHLATNTAEAQRHVGSPKVAVSVFLGLYIPEAKLENLGMKCCRRKHSSERQY